VRLTNIKMSTKKRSLDLVDQPGSGDGKLENSSPVKKIKRESLNPSFQIRLTYEKIEDDTPVDQWINGSTKLDLQILLEEKFPLGRISLEKGDNGQLHFQCTVICAKGKRMRREAVRKYLLDHYPELKFPALDYCEPCKKTWASMQYCAKEDTHVAGPWEWGLEPKINMDLQPEDLPTPYPWQAKLVHRYKDPAPDFHSKIVWYVDEGGQIGKTMTARMLILKNGFYLLDGGPQKMKFQAAKNPAPGYVLNVVRTKEDHFSYEGIENISDGLFCDTFGSDQKGMICRRASHIVVVANWRPDTSKLTLCRWNIYDWNGVDFIKQ